MTSPKTLLYTLGGVAPCNDGLEVSSPSQCTVYLASTLKEGVVAVEDAEQ